MVINLHLHQHLQSPIVRMTTMYQVQSIIKIKFIIIVISLEGIQCSIDGSFNPPGPNDTKTGDNPCNPLYWYPRNIPEYCYINNSPNGPTPPEPDIPIPIPIPVPVPPPLSIPMPILPPPIVPPIMMPPSVMPPGPPPPIMVPNPIIPLPMPLPFGIPLAPTNPMVPVAGIPLPPQPISFPQPYPAPYQPPYLSPYPPPYPPPYASPYPAPFPSPYAMQPQRGIGMVPGIPGLVSPDGGINIMPFSDAYSDMLEKHKQKMIRKRLQKLMNGYDKYPWKSRRKTRRNDEVEERHEKVEDTNSIVE